MKHVELIEPLRELIKGELPGEGAHALVAPFKRKSAREVLASNHNARLSAVLCLIFPVNDIAHFALIRRPEYDGLHSGEIAFPGGKHEGEETLLETALRETFEELGVISARVDVLGELTTVYVPPSNFLISPFVGVADARPDFALDSHEVASLLEIELADLVKEDIVKEKTMKVDTRATGPLEFNAPYFDLLDETVWGATAAVLSEIRQLLLRLPQ